MSLISLSLEDSLVSILIRFIINLIVLFVLIRIIYYRFSKKEENMFSFFLMGTVIFLIVSLLETVEIKIGMALGLFALFAIIRFRTMNLSIKDMTYFFTTIGVSIINSQAHIPPPVLGAIVINSIIILTVFLLEIYLNKRILSSVIIIYNNLKLISPEYKQELIKDLSRHTGQNIVKFKIQKINIHRGNAEVEVFFRDQNVN
jgi:hypothetical protein